MANKSDVGYPAAGMTLAEAAFVRSRLKCVPPFPPSIVRKQFKKLERLRRKIDAAQRVVDQIEHEWNCLAEKVAALGVQVEGWGPYMHGLIPSSVWDWDPVTKEWGTPNPHPIEGRILEEYRTRPEKPEALRIWNGYTRALQQAPERMIRVWGKGYYLEFRDVRGHPVRWCHSLPKDAEIYENRIPTVEEFLTEQENW